MLGAQAQAEAHAQFTVVENEIEVLSSIDFK